MNSLRVENEFLWCFDVWVCWDFVREHYQATEENICSSWHNTEKNDERYTQRRIKKHIKLRERELWKYRHGCNHECSVLSQFSVVSYLKRFGRGIWEAQCYQRKNISRERKIIVARRRRILSAIWSLQMKEMFKRKVNSKEKFARQEKNKSNVFYQSFTWTVTVNILRD